MGKAKIITMACVAAAILFCGGCQSAQVGQPLTQNLSGNEPETQLEFWHALTQRPVTSNDEAFHGLLLFVDGQDDSADYAARVQTLQARQMLPENFKEPANRAVRRGMLAVALTRALEIKGGVVMRVFPRSQRYATREMEFMNLFPPSSPHQTFSGTEFVGIIGRAEDYQRAQVERARATLLPSEVQSEAQTQPAATQPQK